MPSDSAEFASQHGEVDVEDLDERLPYVVEGATLMSPGEWNNLQFSESEIEQAYSRTDWSDEDVVSLFNEHNDTDSRDWVGRVRNPRIEGEDLVGDIEVLDLEQAIKLAGGAEFGISPKVTGETQGSRLKDFVFDNFSLVFKPAVKTTFLNSEVQEVHEAENSKLGEVTMSEDDTTDVADDEQETQNELPVDDEQLDALAERLEDRLLSDDEDEEDDGAEEADADATDEAEVEDVEDAGAEEVDEEVDASEFDEFQDFAEERKSENPDMSISDIAEEFEEANKEPSEKIDEFKQEVKTEIEDLKDTVQSLSEEDNSAEIDPQKLSQKVGEQYKDEREKVSELSDDELHANVRNMLLRVQGQGHLTGE